MSKFRPGDRSSGAVPGFKWSARSRDRTDRKEIVARRTPVDCITSTNWHTTDRRWERVGETDIDCIGFTDVIRSAFQPVKHREGTKARLSQAQSIEETEPLTVFEPLFFVGNAKWRCDKSGAKRLRLRGTESGMLAMTISRSRRTYPVYRLSTSHTL
jgi:hypothetical protein